MTNFEMALRIAGMNGQDLAEITGTGRSYISQLVTGARNLGKSNIAQFAEALDVDQAWLMGFPGQIPVWDPLAEKTLTCQIVRSEDIPEYGTYYIVHHPETGITFGLIVSQGDQLTITDWQGRCPRDASEIQDYDWMDQDGRDCVMMGGLPRRI